MERWSGRVVLVTGASSGIGAGLAERLVNRGMKVVGCARRRDKLQGLADRVKDAPGSFLPVECDLRKESDILAMFDVIKKQYGGLDVCINNAGVWLNGPLVDGNTEHWTHMWEVNVMALSICSREALKSMKEKGVNDGHIIQINSESGHLVDKMAGLHFYDCTKFAVTALTQGLRQELKEAGSGTRVTSISPGWVKTEVMDSMGKEKADKLWEEVRHLTTDDMADAMEYVLSAPPHVEVHEVMLCPVGANDP